MTGVDANTLQMLVENALDVMRKQPKDFGEILEYLARTNDVELNDPLPVVLNHLAISGPNDRVRHALIRRLQQWDHEEKPVWSPATPSHSLERRKDALKLLGFEESDFLRINEFVPIFSESEVAIVIARQHEPWYEARKSKIQSFYWKHYESQLKKPRGSWDPRAIASLDLSTDDVISRLSDPSQKDIYQVKGLVMGYVQSGKTSHFSGLIAKAADAGYRLIIVLSGTMDILRQQTQRRLDKEIVGQELLSPDEYSQDADWPLFVKHGGLPSEIGYFDWERLTDRDRDYSSVKQFLHLLDFKRTDATKPLNHPDNLQNVAARLAVIKKTPTRINKMCADLNKLKELRRALEHVPTLIVDDESDQASVNTIDQKKFENTGLHTKTNLAIGALLNILPRAQYVGYTATPFANVFINPDDAKDIFPKDFIVSLPRPEGYMGVSDFYDFDEEFEEGDPRSNRCAFVRPVVGGNEGEKNLPEAIDSFVLSGAIKLYRQAVDVKKYSFRHHTMLVHHSARKIVHDGETKEVLSLFDGGGRYQKKRGIDGLRKLFDDDFSPVSAVRAGADPFPKSFDELKPFISECISRICDEKPVLTVNGDNADDTPDFDQKPIWAILVGGTKLSRGYTVEGLTTSYYRRPTGAGDTLMQMGRWFGFRKGYGDLVRLYIGQCEPKGQSTINLYDAFGAVCRDEEALRKELLKYAKEGLTPQKVPPLVQQHLPNLPPTARNKMFNAQITFQDFGGSWTEKTVAPTIPADIEGNRTGLGKLLNKSEYLGINKCSLTNSKGQRRSFDSVAAVAKSSLVVEFLGNYRWQGKRNAAGLELNYFEKEFQGGRISDWIVLLPQIDTADTISLSDGYPKLSIVEREYLESRFGVYSEPRHRDVAAFLAGVDEATRASEFLVAQRKLKLPILVVYLVRATNNKKLGVSVGFGIQFPGEQKSKAVVWTVADPRLPDAVVVDKKDGA